MVGHQLDKAKILRAAEFSASTKTILYPDKVRALQHFQVSDLISSLFLSGREEEENIPLTECKICANVITR